MAHKALKAHTSTLMAHKALKAHTSTHRAHKALKAHTSTHRAHRGLKGAHATLSTAAWQEIRVGMTKGGAEFPIGIGCRDPRSQRRDPGHPSIVADAAPVELTRANFL
jgi:hypothetical protein